MGFLFVILSRRSWDIGSLPKDSPFFPVMRSDKREKDRICSHLLHGGWRVRIISTISKERRDMQEVESSSSVVTSHALFYL